MIAMYHYTRMKTSADSLVLEDLVLSRARLGHVCTPTTHAVILAT